MTVKMAEQSQIVTAKGNDTQFGAACKAAKIPPTNRQWKKWNQQKGKAWKTHQK
jgi:hypothetical protein